ncbi:MAG: hypothetical protein ACKOZZ_06420 [Bacteroidota bacterium]|jgi:hypothetical protein
MRKNIISTWGQLSEELNKQDQIPSEKVWIRIQQKKFRQRLIRLSYSSVAASILLVAGVFLFNKDNALSFSGYYYEPSIEKTEAALMLASITFSNTHRNHYGKVVEGKEVKMLIPKKP